MCVTGLNMFHKIKPLRCCREGLLFFFFLEELLYSAVCIFKAWRRSHPDVNAGAPHTWLVERTSCYAVIVASSSDFETAERDERIAAVKQHQILSAFHPLKVEREKKNKKNSWNHEQNKRFCDVFHFKWRKIGLNSYTPAAWNKYVYLQLPWSIWIKLRNNILITEELHCILNIFHLFTLIP